jgi:hypothetical protein
MTKCYPYALKKTDTEWVMECRECAPVHLPIISRGMANDIFQMVNTAYHLGQRDLRKELRDLIGATP